LRRKAQSLDRTIPSLTCTIVSLTGELDKHVAELYEGVGVLTYEQPAGTYSIDVYAIDKSGNVSVKLTTPFYYLPIPAVETDFTSSPMVMFP